MRLEHLLSGADADCLGAVSRSGPKERSQRPSDRKNGFWEYDFLMAGLLKGGLAQLARAPALQAGGQRFESVILHLKEDIDKTGSRSDRAEARN